MKLNMNTKLNLPRLTLATLPLLAAAALFAPTAAVAQSATGLAHRHHELSLSMTCNGACLKCEGHPGDVYCIEATTDLAHPNWQPICAVTNTANGHIEFTDTCSSNYPSRFYRVSWSSEDTNNGHHYGQLKNGNNGNSQK
jgi:hypothetical protein